MTRTVDPVQHAARRDAILDATAVLVGDRGDASITIADILDATGVSKGAFYHYFASKDEVLGALVARGIDRWATAADASLEGLSDPVERLRRLVESFALAKRGDRQMLVKAMPRLLSDANAAMQLRLRHAAVDRFLPLLETIVEDGARSGAFRVRSAAAAARVVMSLVQELSEVSGTDLLAVAEGAADIERLEAHVRAYGDAIPAVLGVDVGADGFLEIDGLDQWVAAVRAPSLTAR